ncbi:hypothetical protein OESDEN_14315 [Oesophagostomum dentatum]|uniref:Protein UNC80 central region domain-containing protein n=1 Tax=Oesophagostomum dentatum TaxID=61180 RepID=A0A0B1SKT5_OESDE|nr:hypothetical protein OESDEN_14315 [Oesophagostomum dentatum]
MEQDRQSAEVTLDEPEEDVNKEMLDYIRTLVLNLVHAPLSSALKSCLLLTPEQYKQLIEVSWQLLLNEDPHVVLSAASMFIVACVRRPEDALKVMKKALDSSNVTDRTEGIQRYHLRGLDFTLPSPAIGQSQLPVVDPPWMPHLKTKIEELSLKEEEHATVSSCYMPKVDFPLSASVSVSNDHDDDSNSKEAKAGDGETSCQRCRRAAV